MGDLKISSIISRRLITGIKAFSIIHRDQENRRKFQHDDITIPINTDYITWLRTEGIPSSILSQGYTIMNIFVP
jgi:hypothetical protein